MLGGPWPRQTTSDKEVARSLPGTYEIRDAVVWPTDLSLPTRPPKLVYLDMLGWINLAEVAVGNAPAGYDRLLKSCRKARAEGRAHFPLSSTHLLEVYNIASVDRRRARAAVMEELSDFSYLMGRPQLQQLEVESALNQIPGVNIPPQGPFALLGPSVWWAFGKEGNLVTNGPDPVGAAKHVCQAMGIALGDDAVVSLSRWCERQLLTGPDDHEAPELVSIGYTIDTWRDILQKRADQENYLVQQLDADPHWRKGRLRDVISARELEIELGDVVASATAAMKTSIGKLLDYDRKKLRDFTDRMPTTRVAVSVKEYFHYDNQHKWASNDMNDIDAIAIAVPYCDAVFTDRRTRTAVASRRDLDFFGTCLPSGPEELADWLDGLPAPAADT